jgi:hypothetical protein
MAEWEDRLSRRLSWVPFDLRSHLVREASVVKEIRAERLEHFTSDSELRQAYLNLCKAYSELLDALSSKHSEEFVYHERVKIATEHLKRTIALP